MVNLSFMMPISLVVSMFIAVLFPLQVGLNDPVGLDAVRAQSFTESSLFSGNLNSYYEDENFFIGGNPTLQDQLVKDTSQLPQSGDQSVITSEGFGFLDYVRIVSNGILSIFIFLSIPFILLFNLGYPFNVLFALPYSALYSLAIANYLLGRS